MEWVKMSLGEVVYGSIIRWQLKNGEFIYVIYVNTGFFININNDYAYSTLDTYQHPPDFVEVLYLTSSKNIPTNSIIRLAQYMVEDSLDQ